MRQHRCRKLNDLLPGERPFLIGQTERARRRVARSITHAGPKVGEREVVARHQKRSTRTDRQRAKRQWPNCGHAGPRLFRFVDKSRRSAKKQNRSSFDRRFGSHILGSNTVRLLTRQRLGLVGEQVWLGSRSGLVGAEVWSGRGGGLVWLGRRSGLVGAEVWSGWGGGLVW
jgi:hypothetical protein